MELAASSGTVKILVGIFLVFLVAVSVIALGLGIGLGVGLSEDNLGGGGAGSADSVVYEGPLVAKCTSGSFPQTPQNKFPNVRFVKNLNDGGVSWFASPVVYDLDGDGHQEIIAAFYNVYVYNASYELKAQTSGNGHRVYPPHVVQELDNDNNPDIVVGQYNELYCYNYDAANGRLTQKWVASVVADTSNKDVEIRGMAAADIDGDSIIDIMVTTTRTDGTSVFAFDGRTGNPKSGWPRYQPSDLAAGQDGYGEYGLNVGIGHLNNSDSNVQIVTTFDDHQIQVFNNDGTTVYVSDYFTSPKDRTSPMKWGGFFRWYDAWVEEAYYHNHTYQASVQYNPWLQFTDSAPSVADLNNDGQAEVIAVPNIEIDPSNSGDYQTIHYAVIVLQGVTQPSVSGLRFPGWDVYPKGKTPIQVGGYYPPHTPPAPVIVDIIDGPEKEIIVTLNDGGMYCFNYQSKLLWSYNFMNGNQIMFSSEATVADLNNDGSYEVIFTTFGSPDVDSGYLIILAANGAELQKIKLNTQGLTNGNGNGAPSAPTVADVDGDGKLEILVQTFEHGMDIYTVTESTSNCVKWPSARGGYQRIGAPDV